MNKIAIALVAALACAASVQGAEEKTMDQEGAALAAANRWLALVDAGDYASSWQEAAALFRSAVKKEDWVSTMEALRKPMGSLRSRSLKSQAYTTVLPGAPDGEYVVIQFDASFDGKTEAVETVTPMRDPDGAWRVSGYFIR